MAGVRVELFGLRSFNFAGLTAGTSTEFVVFEALDVSDYTEGTLLVRVHSGTNLGGSSTLFVNMNVYAPSPDDPSNDPSFSKFISRVSLDSSTPVPGLVSASLGANFGEVVRVSVTGTRDSGGAFAQAVVSAEVSLKMSTPAFRQYVAKIMRVLDRLPIEAGLALAAEQEGYDRRIVKAHAREFRRFLALCAAARCVPKEGLHPLWARLFAQRFGDFVGALGAGEGELGLLKESYVEAFGEFPPRAMWDVADGFRLGSEDWLRGTVAKMTKIQSPGQAGFLSNLVNLATSLISSTGSSHCQKSSCEVVTHTVCYNKADSGDSPQCSTDTLSSIGGP